MLAALVFVPSAVVFIGALAALSRLPGRRRVFWTQAAALMLSGAGLLAGTVLWAAGLEARPTWNVWWVLLLAGALAAFAYGTVQSLRIISR